MPSTPECTEKGSQLLLIESENIKQMTQLRGKTNCQFHWHKMKFSAQKIAFSAILGEYS